VATITLEEGFNYILGHFEGQRLFPRTISTRTTEGRQVLVNSIDEALARFAQANFLDCRISAYPLPSDVSSFVGVNLDMAPSVVMIDLDRETFKTQRAFAMALTKTLKKIARQLNSQPTVIWSGRGYHIYLVLEAFVLEAEDAFNNRRFGQQPLQKFLRFEEWYLSNGRCDPQHNKTVSSRNCMLRIPGSVNSKNGQVVRIEQRWNGYRPNIKFLLEDFYVYLFSERIAELEEKRRKKFRGEFGRVSGSCIPSTIHWIERLLRFPIQDYRKFSVWRVLAPYLINVKKISEEEAANIIETWLIECSKLNQLNIRPKSKIRETLHGAAKGYRPISCEKLKAENEGFYNLLQKKGVLT
jgi:non-catalytic primase subunit PriX-like protein